MDTIKVIIKDKRFIPTIGKGPFLEPITITEEIYRFLKIGKYRVQKYDPTKDTKNVINNKKPLMSTDINIDESEIPEEDKNVKITFIAHEIDEDETENEATDEVEVEEETVEDEAIDEVEDETVEDETEDEATDEVEEEIDYSKMTVKELKALLDEYGIDYKYNDTKDILIEKAKTINK